MVTKMVVIDALDIKRDASPEDLVVMRVHAVFGLTMQIEFRGSRQERNFFRNKFRNNEKLKLVFE